MQTAHFVGPDPEAFVADAGAGLVLTSPQQLGTIPQQKIVFRKDIDTFRKSHVTIIGLGGSGHEPMFSGYVGSNFLSASIAGKVFASPTSSQMFEAIKLCASDKGTLLVFGNYTGDTLNAGLAITRAHAHGYKVEFMAIGDDAAVPRTKGRKVGRRGLAGHLVPLKLVCAHAEQGADFEIIRNVANDVCGNIATAGVSFDKCSLPGSIIADVPLLPEGSLEMGVGIHGEPGVQKMQPIPSPRSLVESILQLILDTSDKERSFIDIRSGDRVCMFVNSLQGVGNRDLIHFASLAVQVLKSKGINVERLLWGPLVTSLDMSGIGITIYRLPRNENLSESVLTSQEALRLWDIPVDCSWT